MESRLVIFDLDGTLLNTIADLGAAVNAALARRSLPLHSNDEYTKMVGHGIRNLVLQALESSLGTKADDAMVDEVLQDFVDHYVKNIDILTRPYDGIPELLEKLQAAGISLAIASNKFQQGAEQLVREFFPSIDFVAILGNSPELPLKPDKAVVELIQKRIGIDSTRTTFVGDSATDIRTAQNAACRSIGVTWGFRPESDLIAAGAGQIAHSASELENYLLHE